MDTILITTAIIFFSLFAFVGFVVLLSYLPLFNVIAYLNFHKKGFALYTFLLVVLFLFCVYTLYYNSNRRSNTNMVTDQYGYHSKFFNVKTNGNEVISITFEKGE
jgi:hypothetical protein